MMMKVSNTVKRAAFYIAAVIVSASCLHSLSQIANCDEVDGQDQYQDKYYDPSDQNESSYESDRGYLQPEIDGVRHALIRDAITSATATDESDENSRF